MWGVVLLLQEKTKAYTWWFYNTPRVGGHLQINPDTAVTYPLFTAFPECRIQTALILVFYNSQSKTHNKITSNA